MSYTTIGEHNKNHIGCPITLGEYERIVGNKKGKFDILDTITYKALTQETKEKIDEYLLKEDITSEDTIMVMDTCERLLVAVIMFKNKTIPLPIFMSEEEDKNLKKLMENAVK